MINKLHRFRGILIQANFAITNLSRVQKLSVIANARDGEIVKAGFVIAKFISVIFGIYIASAARHSQYHY